ncbi:unnamed protein product [Anisakis simplex]|uniref:Secreted protein n=1 Tax=Anisakis simplex TaxID=6269 RepID=A0A0M3JND7_ANISI|nr:unnamed protein product [Anisakis simplex]
MLAFLVLRWCRKLSFLVCFKREHLKAPSLSGEGAPLKAGLQEGKDYEILAPCLWRSLLRWHGGAAREGIALPRRVLPTSYVEPSSLTPSLLTVELYPLTLLILRHTTASGSWLQSAFGRFLHSFLLFLY